MKKIVSIFCCLVLCIFSFGFAPIKSEPKFKASILVDCASNQVLSEQNSLSHLPIASVTKLTTLLLCFEAIEHGELSIDEQIVASEYASSMGGSQVFIDANSSYSVLSLLHALVIASANDACVVLAERIAGSEESFVELMNNKVDFLGGKNTHYTNCTGLPSPSAFSCAHDVALVMTEVVKYPLYFEISKIKLEDFSHPSGRTTQMANTNKLLSTYAFCDGGKTGFTNEAKFCMCATAVKQGMRLISVVLGAESSAVRFDSCKSFFDWGFNSFSTHNLVSIDNYLDVPNIHLAKEKAQCVPVKSYSVTLLKNEENPYVVDYTFAPLSAPLIKGDIVGKAVIKKGSVVCAEIDLVLVSDVPALTILDLSKRILSSW